MHFCYVRRLRCVAFRWPPNRGEEIGGAGAGLWVPPVLCPAVFGLFRSRLVFALRLFGLVFVVRVCVCVCVCVVFLSSLHLVFRPCSARTAPCPVPLPPSSVAPWGRRGMPPKKKNNWRTQADFKCAWRANEKEGQARMTTQKWTFFQRNLIF